MGLSGSKIVVLVVDDEPMIRMYAVEVMEEAGYGVLEAANGADALAMLDNHPEVTSLFTDIQMPGAFDGLALPRKVHELRPDIRLFIASGNLRPSDDEIPDDGQFFAKPYDAYAVARMIGRHAGNN